MQGGTTYNDTNNLQLTGAITIYPDENKEFMDIFRELTGIAEEKKEETETTDSKEKK